MQSFNSFKKDAIRALDNYINGLLAGWPKDKPLTSLGIKNQYAFFLFDSSNEIISLSYLNLVLDVDKMYGTTTKSYPEILKEVEEGKFNPTGFYNDIDYELELDFYWYLQRQYKANYLSICELEIIGEKYYLISKFLNLSDMTEYIDISEAVRNTNEGKIIFNKTIQTDDKSKILDNIPGILELFSSRIDRNWSEEDLKTLGVLYSKHQDQLAKFNTKTKNENTWFTELDAEIRPKLVIELITLNGRSPLEALTNCPEFKIVSITDKVRLLQSKNIPLFQCMIELESQSLWSTSIDGDSILKKELEDIINGARNGNPEESSGFMGLYIMFRVKLDFPNILSDEQIFTNIAMTTKEFKKQNLMP